MRRLQRVAGASNRAGLNGFEGKFSSRIGCRPAKARKRIGCCRRGLPDFHTSIVGERARAVPDVTFNGDNLTARAEARQV